MKKHLQVIGVLLLMSSTSFSQNAVFDWAKKMGGSGLDGAGANAVDASGNVYTIGTFTNTANFNPGGTFNLTSAGANDAFVSKLDASGNFVWAFKLGGTTNDRGNAIAVDAVGDVYVAGQFTGTVNFNPSGTFNLTSAGNDDIFIAKYSSAGSFIWAKKIGGTSVDIAYAIAVDASSNVYTTGYFLGTVNFNPSGTFNLTSAGDSDVFVSKLDASGNFVWAKNMGGAFTDIAYGIAVDASNNVYTTGFFEDVADFDPSGVNNSLISIGTGDIFVSKLNSLGNYVWAKRMGGILEDTGSGITTDASGNVYTGGRFTGAADFGSSNFVSLGNIDAYVSKIDASGNFLWSKQLGGIGMDAVYSLKTDATGNVYSTGYFSDVVDFNPNAGINLLTSEGAADAFILKLDNAGNYGWVKQMGGTGGDYGQFISLTSTGNIFTSGTFSGTTNFNMPNTFNLTASSSDVFVHKLIPCATTYGTVNGVACASTGGYVLNSQTYTTTGTYTQNLTNAAGCDSILTVNVYISSVMSATVSQTNITCIGASNGTASITSVSGGTSPYSYNWMPGNITSATATNLSVATYTCVITDSIGCTTLQYASITQPSQTQIPEICMVTVDGQSVNNIIYWDRSAYAQADSFIVHREVSTNLYRRIGAVSVDSIGQLIDTARSVGPANGNPNVGSYRYKLQMRDTCGNYSSLSPYHNTIYIIDAGLGQFVWSVPYTIEGGSNPVLNYILLCDTANVDVWGPVATVAGTQISATDPGFATHASTANWRVKTDWGITCDPSRATINTTRSNIKGAAMVTSINEALNMFVNVYPNPASTAITIQIPQLPSIPTIVIFNAVGQIVHQQRTAQLTETINVEEFAKGVYTVAIQTQYGNVYKKLIIQ